MVFIYHHFPFQDRRQKPTGPGFLSPQTPLGCQFLRLSPPQPGQFWRAQVRSSIGVLLSWTCADLLGLCCSYGNHRETDQFLHMAGGLFPVARMVAAGNGSVHLPCCSLPFPLLSLRWPLGSNHYVSSPCRMLRYRSSSRTVSHQLLKSATQDSCPFSMFGNLCN